jgi:hypothetical protein
VTRARGGVAERSGLSAKLNRLLTQMNCRITSIARLRDAGAISESEAEQELKQGIAFRAELMRQIDGQEFAVARFRQVNKGRSNAHHDALEFPDGKIVLLTQLCKGQHATVLQLPVTSPVTANEAQRHGSLVA